jgi:hypothetical protein
MKYFSKELLKGRWTQKKSTLVFSFLALFVLSNPVSAFANAGVPMIALTFPVMLAALIPIILIEAKVLSEFFKIRYWFTLLPSLAANLLSTLIGFPLSWCLLFGVELLTTGGSAAFGISTALGKIIAVTLQSAWLIPYENELGWMMPIAAAVGFIPAYFISVSSEAWVVRKFFRDRDPKDVWRAVRKANRVTYGLLIVLCLAIFAMSLAGRRR